MKAVKLQTSIAQTEVRSSRGKEIEQISLNLIPGSRRIAMFVGFTLLSLVAIFIVVLLVGEQFTMTNAISHPARLPVLRIANYESLNTGNLKSQSHVQVVETWTLNQLKKQYIRRSSFFGIRHATKRVRNAFVGVLRKVGSANRKVGHFIKAGTTAVKSAFSRLRHGKPSGKIATNDRIEVDIDTLGLSLKQKKRIHEILKEVIEEGGTEMQEAAAESHFELTPHLVYRYLASVDWAEKYNGKRFAQAIQDTVLWRRGFGMNTTSTAAAQEPHLVELVRRGFAYVSPVPDKDGRAVVYLKVARNFKSRTVPDYLNLLMYTMERADRQSVAFRSGEFISVMDLDGLTYAQCPPVSFLKQAIHLLKSHYPYRLSAVYVVNAGGAFNLLYNMLKPILPKKALTKTYVLKPEDSNAFLVDTIGADHLEERYGGKLKEYFHQDNSTVADVLDYYSTGYWNAKK